MNIILLLSALMFGLYSSQPNLTDNHQPNGSHTTKTTGVEVAIQHTKLLPPPEGIGGDRGEFGTSISADGDRMLVGGPKLAGSGAVYVMERQQEEAWKVTAVLQPADGGTADMFGVAVSLSGDRAFIGTYSDRTVEAGSVYVFDFNGTEWVQTQKIIPDNISSGDFFGYRLSLSGNRALIAATGDDSKGLRSGAVYVYDYDGVSWNQSQKLTASDGAAEASFGWSVSLLGDRALVGSLVGFGGTNEPGAAYVFDFDGNSWSQTHKLTAVNPIVGQGFGISVSLSTDRALIGAFEGNGISAETGTAFVFDYDGANWNQTQEIYSDDGGLKDGFGWSVSLQGNQALIGTLVTNRTAYVYDFDGASWNQAGKLVDNTAVPNELSNSSVSLSENRAFLGLPLNDVFGRDSGSVVVHAFNGSDWVRTAQLHSGNGAAHDQFGLSVSLSGNHALIGARFNDDKSPDSGSAIVFNFDETNWLQTQKLFPNDTEDFKQFGYQVSLSGYRAIVTAPLDDDRGNASGSAYVFEYDPDISQWVQTQKLTASDGASGDWFGYSVHLIGERALIGANLNNQNGYNSGAVYVFDYDGNQWSETQKLTAQDGNELDHFGASVSLHADMALIGAWGTDDSAENSGAAYLFVFNGQDWVESTKLTATDAIAQAQFGRSVSLSNDRAVIGAVNLDFLSTLPGSAYIFDYDGVNWSQQQKLTAGNTKVQDGFGSSVDLAGDRILVGAWKDIFSDTNSGATYLYGYDGDNWNMNQKIGPTDADSRDGFGISVSQSVEHILVGSWRDDDRGDNSGSAYVFNLLPDLIFADSFDNE